MTGPDYPAEAPPPETPLVGSARHGGQQRPLRAIDLDTAVRMYESGLSLRAVAPVVGLSPTQLRRRLLRAGFALRPARRGGRQRTRKAIDVTAAVRMYESGQSLRAISDVVGLSPHRVRLRLLQAGVTMRPTRVRAPASDDRIVELRGQGLTWDQIGDAVGMTASGARTRFHTVTGWPAEPNTTPGKTRITDEQILQIIGWGATHRQAAEMLGLTVGAVGARVYRARRRRATQ